MTREETVWYVNHTFEIIKEELCNSGRFDEAKEFEIAQNMAIEALQFQDIMINNPKSAKPTPEVCKTCMDNEQTEAITDCISRERAIEVVKRAKTKEIAYSALINLEPKEIPTCDECRLPKCLADKQDDWIPVSERLPEKSKQVMCCDKQGRVFTSAMTHINSNGEPSFGKHYSVTAWRPLPEPYKEEKSSDL